MEDYIALNPSFICDSNILKSIPTATDNKVL